MDSEPECGAMRWRLIASRVREARSVLVLLTEASSLSAREAVSALGPLGYRIEVCDPDPWCVCRFSRFVRAGHDCRPAGWDPRGYLDAMVKLLSKRRFDVLLPIHEQAYLIARAASVAPRRPSAGRLRGFRAGAEQDLLHRDAGRAGVAVSSDTSDPGTRRLDGPNDLPLLHENVLWHCRQRHGGGKLHLDGPADGHRGHGPRRDPGARPCGGRHGAAGDAQGGRRQAHGFGRRSLSPIDRRIARAPTDARTTPERPCVPSASAWAS